MLDAELKIAQIRDETPDVKTFRLDLAGQTLDFLAGQFSSLTIPTPAGPQVRSFSISSAPLGQTYLEITVKRYPDSIGAQALHAMQPGDTLKVRAPFGKFVLDEAVTKPVFIAGGNGITPFMSMLRYIAAKKLPVKPVFLYSNRSEADIIFYNELKEMADAGIVDLRLTLTDQIPQDWKGLCGRFDGPMLEKELGDLKQQTFFLCGPPAMVTALTTTLLEKEVPESSIRAEKFVRPKGV